MKSPSAPDATELAQSLGRVSVAEESVKLLLQAASRFVAELGEMRDELARIKEHLLSFQK
jgi:hypothetical protein